MNKVRMSGRRGDGGEKEKDEEEMGWWMNKEKGEKNERDNKGERKMRWKIRGLEKEERRWRRSAEGGGGKEVVEGKKRRGRRRRKSEKGRRSRTIKREGRRGWE